MSRLKYGVKVSKVSMAEHVSVKADQIRGIIIVRMISADLLLSF